MNSFVMGGGLPQPQQPSFTQTGRSTLTNFLFGAPESYFNIPQRQQLYGALSGGALQGVQPSFDFLSRLLSGDQSIFQELEAPALRQFQEQIVPGLAERFTGMGLGAQGSSGYQQVLGGAASRLAQDLAGQRSQYRMSALDRLLSQAGQTMQARPYDVVPRTPGFLENVISSGAENFGKGAGLAAGLALI